MISVPQCSLSPGPVNLDEGIDVDRDGHKEMDVDVVGAKSIVDYHTELDGHVAVAPSFCLSDAFFFHIEADCLMMKAFICMGTPPLDNWTTGIHTKTASSLKQQTYFTIKFSCPHPKSMRL